MGEADALADSMAMLSQQVDQIRQPRPMKKLILDLNSSVSEIDGRRDRSGSAAAERRPLQPVVRRSPPIVRRQHI